MKVSDWQVMMTCRKREVCLRRHPYTIVSVMDWNPGWELFGHLSAMHQTSTSLYWACVNGHTEVAQYLPDNGASVNLGDDKPLIAAIRGCQLP